jgi:hypothetical protein
MSQSVLDNIDYVSSVNEDQAARAWNARNFPVAQQRIIDDHEKKLANLRAQMDADERKLAADIHAGERELEAERAYMIKIDKAKRAQDEACQCVGKCQCDSSGLHCTCATSSKCAISRYPRILGIPNVLGTPMRDC